jgi:hypothetical protein
MLIKQTSQSASNNNNNTNLRLFMIIIDQSADGQPRDCPMQIDYCAERQIL